MPRRETVIGFRHPRKRLVEDDIIARTGATCHAVRLAFAEFQNAGLDIRAQQRCPCAGLFGPRDRGTLRSPRMSRMSGRAVFRLPCFPETIEALTDIAIRHREA